MTKEEAIERLKNYTQYRCGGVDLVALNMAIQALEQEPCNDTVSRGVFEQVMWERDTAIEQLRKLGYGLGQKIEPCDDAVSRQAVNDLYDRYHPTLATCVYEFGEELKALPSVNPTREHGEWIEEKHGYRCNKCNRYYKGEWSIKNNAMMPHKYCPNCGAKMESEG